MRYLTGNAVPIKQSQQRQALVSQTYLAFNFLPSNPPRADLCQTTGRFAAKPSYLPMLSGFYPQSFPSGSRISIKSLGRGLACNVSCYVISTSEGIWTVSNTGGGFDVVLLKQGSECIAVVGGEVVQTSCPSSIQSRFRLRQSQIFPYWSPVSLPSGISALINGNGDCLRTLRSGGLTMGNCLDGSALGWNIAAVSDASNVGSGGGAPVGVIAGGVVAGLVAIAAAIGLGIYFRRRKKNAADGASMNNGIAGLGMQGMELNKTAVPNSDSTQTLADQDGYNQGYYGAKPDAALPLPPKELGNGGPVYFLFGGDLVKGVVSVPVRTFARARFAFQATNPDEISMSFDGV